MALAFLMPRLFSDCLVNRYAFRSTEKVALQEIGPRFTLKLRSLRKGLPAVKSLAERGQDLEFDTFENDAEGDKAIEDGETAEDEDEGEEKSEDSQAKAKKTLPPKEDQYQWQWKVSSSAYQLVYCRLTLAPSPNSRQQDVPSSCSFKLLYNMQLILRFHVRRDLLSSISTYPLIVDLVGPPA